MLKFFAKFFSSSNATKMALIVRSDVKMSKGKTSAQCAHASVLCYQTTTKSNPSVLKDWCFSGQPKIVLKIDSIDKIKKLAQKAKNLNVTSEIVYDAGLTQLKPGTVTVIGLGPDKVEKIDQLIEDLKLL